MDILVLDNNFISVDTIDDFLSVIWNENYLGCGDFEMYAPINSHMLYVADLVREKRKQGLDTYFLLKESEQVMIVEKIEMTTDVDYGPRMIFSGRSLESILYRRIVWRQTVLEGDFQGQFEKLLNENVIHPSIAERKIPNFVFVPSTDPKVTELKISKQFTGDNLYEVIYECCELLDLGFRICLTNDNKFSFSFYFGVDRSYDQMDRPFVIFSPRYENLVRSNFLEDSKDQMTVALVSGEDEGTERRTQVVGGGSGLSRRELFTDARDIQSEIYNEEGEKEIIPDEQYYANLRQRGEEKLSEHKFLRIFEGEVTNTEPFVYGVDFFKGDLVQVETEYNVYSKMRIMQMVRSRDENGFNYYPVFKIITE